MEVGAALLPSRACRLVCLAEKSGMRGCRRGLPGALWVWGQETILPQICHAAVAKIWPTLGTAESLRKGRQGAMGRFRHLRRRLPSRKQSRAGVGRWHGVPALRGCALERDASSQICDTYRASAQLTECYRSNPFLTDRVELGQATGRLFERFEANRGRWRCRSRALSGRGSGAALQDCAGVDMSVLPCRKDVSR